MTSNVAKPITLSGLVAPCSTSTLSFRPARGRTERMAFLKKAFKKIIEPTEGSQKALLKKIESGEKMTCRLLFEGENPIGALVYKKKLSNHTSLGIKNSLAIKYMFLMQPDIDVPKGFDGVILDRIISIANKRSAESLHVTMSEEDKLYPLLQQRCIAVKTFEPASGVKTHLFHLILKQEPQKKEQQVDSSKISVITTSDPFIESVTSKQEENAPRFSKELETQTKEKTKPEQAQNCSSAEKENPFLLANPFGKKAEKERHFPRKRKTPSTLSSLPKKRLMTCDSSYNQNAYSNSSYGKRQDDFRSERDSHYRPSYNQNAYSNSSYGKEQDDFRSERDSHYRPSYNQNAYSNSSYGKEQDDFRSERDSHYGPSYNQNAYSSSSYGKEQDDFRSERGFRSDRRRYDPIRRPHQAQHKGGHAKLHPMTLKNQYLQMIKQGTKTIEGRINSGIFASRKAGDCFRFYNQIDSVNCEITHVATYKSFREMLETEGYQHLVPNERSLEDAIQAYERIPGYMQKAEKFGVVALHLKKSNRQELINFFYTQSGLLSKLHLLRQKLDV